MIVNIQTMRIQRYVCVCGEELQRKKQMIERMKTFNKCNLYVLADVYYHE